jgi:hypothetical protein
MSRNGDSTAANRNGGALLVRLLFPAACTALAIFVVAESASLGLWLRYGPGPGLFPAIMAIIILLTAWGLFATSAGGKSREPKEEKAGGKEVSEGGEPSSWLNARVWQVVACTAAGLIAIELSDLVVGSAVMIGSLLILVEKAPLVRSVAYTALFCLGVWAIFYRFFGVS